MAVSEGLAPELPARHRMEKLTLALQHALELLDSEGLGDRAAAREAREVLATRYSRFYEIRPDDPTSPQLLDEYRGMKPGDPVVYNLNLALPGDHVLTELVAFPLVDDESGQALVPAKLVQAIIDDGAYEVNADNLAKAVQPR